MPSTSRDDRGAPGGSGEVRAPRGVEAPPTPVGPVAQRSDERAEGPVGALIGFATAALFAVAAAGMFLDLGDEARDHAAQSGREALATARTTVEVRGVVGRILAGGTALDTLNVTVGLAPGSDPLDLSTLVLDLRNRTAQRVLLRAASPAIGNFTVAAVRDLDGSIASKVLLNFDDLATLDANLSVAMNDLRLPPREPVHLRLEPNPGAPVRVELTTPATYAGKTIVTLR